MHSRGFSEGCSRVQSSYMPWVLALIQQGGHCAHMSSLKLGADTRNVHVADREALQSALRTTSVALSPEGVAGTWCDTAPGRAGYLWSEDKLL